MILTAVAGRQMTTETLQITIMKIILTICLPVKVGNRKKNKQTSVILKFTKQPDGQSDMVCCYSG